MAAAGTNRPARHRPGAGVRPCANRLASVPTARDPPLGKLGKTTALKIGDPLDEKTDIGTIIKNKEFTKACKYAPHRK